MITTSIDAIVRSALMSHQLPIHYYVQFLHYALKCVQELNFDVLQNIKSVKLTVNEFSEVPLPADYIDYCVVGVEVGQRIRPLSMNQRINRLPNTDAGGNQIAYPNDSTVDYSYLSYNYDGYFFSSFINSKGQHIGRYFGYGASTDDSFRVIEDRGVIQLDQSIGEGAIIYMEYLYLDTAATTSLVAPYAQNCIEAYITWMFRKWDNRIPRVDVEMSKREFYNELRILRARKDDLTKSDILSISRKYNKQAPKL